MIKNAARQTARLSYVIACVLLILLALFTATARLGLPLLASQKSNIEARVSDYLDSPAKIGALSVRWEGLGPILIASDVSVLDRASRKVALKELLIDINFPKSLLRGIPVISELSLVGANLAVEANAAGQLSLHGMESVRARPGAADVIAPEDKAEGVDIIAWLFNARKVGLLETRLTLIDQTTGRKLVVDDLNIRAESNGNEHQLRIDAQLPDSLGGRVEAGMDLVSRSRDLVSASGSLYVAADTLKVSALNRLLHASGLLAGQAPVRLAFDAKASVQLWGEFKDGQLLAARGPLVLDQIVEKATNETLFDNVTAQLSLDRDGLTKLSISDLRASTGSKLLEIEQVSIIQGATLTEANGAEPTPRWQLRAVATELPADLAIRLARMSVTQNGSSLENAVRNMSASGAVRDLSLNISNALPELGVNISARFDDIEVRGDARIPSVGPLSGDISIVDSLGQFSFKVRQMPLKWSAISDASLMLDSLDAIVDIDVRNRRRLLVDADIQMTDNGLESTTRLSATMVPGQSPHLDIQSRFDVADITVLKDWLPRKSMSRAAAAWIDRAITAGKASDGRLIFFGNMDDFPFDEGEGVFQASVDISDGELAFLPNWPSASNINGSIELDGLRLSGVATDSMLEQFKVSSTRVNIANLAAPVVELVTTAGGRFQELVEFGVDGPLQDILRPAIGDVSGTGNAQMDLELDVSLFGKPAETASALRIRSWRPFRVNGSVFFDRNDVTFGRAGLRLDNALGAVGFTHRGININNLAGQVLGHNVRITGQSVGRGSDADTTVVIKGVVEANDLLAHYGNPLDQFVSGASQWTAKITAPHSGQRVISEGVGFELSGDLVGAQLLLPPPFDKNSSTAVPFILQTAFRADTDEQIWKAEYGDALSAHVRVIDNDMHSLLMQLGDNRVEDTIGLLEQPGIRLQGSVQQLAADDWVSTVNQYIDSMPDGDGDPQLILPVSASLDTQALILGSRSLGQASFSANTDDTFLNLVVSNEAVAGNLRYPRKHWQKDTALKARIQRLDWSVIDALNSDALAMDGQRSAELDPRILPPIEARVSLLVRNKLNVRDLVLRTQPNVSGLDITTLGFAYDTMRLVGKGHWHLRDPQHVSSALLDKHQTRLNLVLQSDDFGTGLDEVGLSEVLDDTQGSIAMNFSWPGPLYKPEITRLDGEVTVDLQAGSIVPFEPGAGRMMGLFAVQALPRRLNLDFKDVTGDGLAFTSIVGSAVIENGIAQVPLLQMTGPIGVVDIVGTSDLDAQQFDQQVTVLPRVSAALPIIGAISGGASAGIGALVAAGFLKAMGLDFDRIGLRTYSLKGPWADPEFTPLTTSTSR